MYDSTTKIILAGNYDGVELHDAYLKVSPARDNPITLDKLAVKQPVDDPHHPMLISIKLSSESDTGQAWVQRSIKTELTKILAPLGLDVTERNGEYQVDIEKRVDPEGKPITFERVAGELATALIKHDETAAKFGEAAACVQKHYNLILDGTEERYVPLRRFTSAEQWESEINGILQPSGANTSQGTGYKRY